LSFDNRIYCHLTMTDKSKGTSDRSFKFDEAVNSVFQISALQRDSQTKLTLSSYITTVGQLT